MENNRITRHPILPVDHSKKVPFLWNGKLLHGYTHDTIASALIANGIHVFGHHHKDHSPQGIFCANGQCAQCSVLVDGVALKACMTPLQENMAIRPLEGLPAPIEISIPQNIKAKAPKEIKPEVLIIGGGPAGLSAAGKLGSLGIEVLLIDDKAKFGGKLVLQTHRFFGSSQEVYAGHRGIEIAEILTKNAQAYDTVTMWASCKAVAVFSDKKIGVVNKENEYLLIAPRSVLFATGARENSLMFPGNTLPGVIGAGAFQTLVNRDLVMPGKSIFIVGGGNVGLIAGYHALQAGIPVTGLIEAMPECGGYQVHRDKLARLGVPILTSHTIVSANGSDHVESVTIAECDASFSPVKGSEETIPCDTILIAVGLLPVNELFTKAVEYEIDAYAAGDANEIAEASAAMISGKIAACEMLQNIGYAHNEDLIQLRNTLKLLSARPGKAIAPSYELPDSSVMPIIHCNQEIPCNPCSAVCPIHNIIIAEEDILHPPIYLENPKACINCTQCVRICPGLAITIVDRSKDSDFTTVTLPVEFFPDRLPETLPLTDQSGNVIYHAIPEHIVPAKNSTWLIKVKVPANVANAVAGFQLQKTLMNVDAFSDSFFEAVTNETIICRCERVTYGEIKALIDDGITDINQIKAITRAGMGACGAKTCHSLIQQILRRAGYAPDEITLNTTRPLFFEVDFKTLANQGKGQPGD
ncbi:MAG TPA: sulfurtransferase [Chloroflexi bacterium]|nr:sulfurtransferase [Chloroflexota bacterium]